jgi:hypothetical protein
MAVRFDGEMATIVVTGFLPDEWPDFIELIDRLVPEHTGLYRWDEWRADDGSRMRAAAVVRNEGGPTLDELARYARRQALAHYGFTSVAFEDALARHTLEDPKGRILRVAHHPIPPRVVIDLHEAFAPLDLTTMPAVAVMLKLTERAGTTRLKRLHRFAELDGERQNTFFPPTTLLEVGGPYDRARLCAVLEETGFYEDGELWIRQTELVRAEIRLLEDVKIKLSPWIRGSIPG